MFTKLKQHKWYFFLILGILFLSLFIFRQYIFGGYYLLSKGFMSDLLRANLPAYYLLYDSIEAGGNFWSWKMGIGTSMFTHADGYIDPFTYITFIFGRDYIPNMMVWLFVTKLVFEGISFFAYIDYFKIDKRAGLIASIMYAFSGYSLVIGNNFALGTILVYTPIIFLGIEKWLDTGKVKTLMLGLFLTCIYSYYFFYIVGIFSIIYVCVRIYQKGKIEKLLGRLLALAGIALTVILLSSFALLPQIEMVMSSSRVSSGKAVGFDINLFLPQIKAWITAIVRSLSNDILGNLTTNSYIGYSYLGFKDYFQMSCYSSAFFIILLIQYLHYEKEKIKHCAMIFGIISVITVFPIFPYILNAFSAVNARWMFIITVVECLGIGIFINSILKNKEIHGTSLVYGIIASNLIILVGLFLLSVTITNVIAIDFGNYIAHAKNYILALMFLYILFCSIYALQNIKNKKIRNIIISTFIAILLFADIGINHYQCYGLKESVCKYSTEDKSSYEDASAELIHKIQKQDKSFYRINKTFDSVYDINGIPSENDAMVQGYFGLKNYNSLNNPSYIDFLQKCGIYVTIPAKRDEYMQNGTPPESLTGSHLNYINGVYDSYNLMSYLGVKYLITEQENQNLPKNFCKDTDYNGLICYENTNYYPLAFSNEKKMSLEEFLGLSYADREYALLEYTITDDIQTEKSTIRTAEKAIAKNAAKKQENFRLISFSEDYIKFNIKIEEGENYLSTTIPFDKNWTIYIDGKRTESCKLNISMLGSKITSGTHMVELKYIPRYFYAGILVTTFTALLLIIFRRKFKNIINKIVQINWKIPAVTTNKTLPGASEKTESKLTRNSNIELLRILCMLVIIAHHCVVHGGSYNMPQFCTNKIISLFLLPGGKLGFDCFLAISCWYLVDQNYKTSRFIKVWLQVLFYSVLFSVIAFSFGTTFTLTGWLSVFLPITGNSHGFAATYLAFYLLLPFLKRMTQNLNKKQARLLLALLLYLEVFSQIIGQIDGYSIPIYSELLLFILCYVIALNLKKWPIKICQRKGVMLGIFCMIWYLLFIIRYLYSINPENPLISLFIRTLFDESSITNLVGGFALFFVFINMKERKIPVVNILAAGTFGILLFHDHNFFRYVLWKDLLKAESWYYHEQFIWIMIGIVILIFLTGFVIDRIRFYLFEKTVFNNTKVIKSCKKCDALINGYKTEN